MADETAETAETAETPAPGATSGESAARPEHEVTTTPAAPKDDVVSSRHTLRIGRRTLRYTATTGRVVLRDEVHEDGKFAGFRPKAEMSLTAYVVDAPAGANRPVTFAFNGGPGSSSRVAAPRSLRAPARRHGRRRRAHRPAVPAGGQRRLPPGGQRPGLHRPRLHRVLPGCRGRQREGVPRLHRRHRERRRADPPVDHPAQPLDVPQVPGRRVLRHPAGGRPGRAPAEPTRPVPQRGHAHLERARPGLHRAARAGRTVATPSSCRRTPPWPTTTASTAARA